MTKLVVGLGNPGKKYEDSRHNVGFSVVDRLVCEFDTPGYIFSEGANAKYLWVSVGGEKIEFLKPQTYVNNSGQSVIYAYKKHPELKLKNIFVVHDDLDIKLGEYKIQFGKGPKIHNGLVSVYKSLGTKDFWHVRVGTENRSPGERGSVSGEKYVLQKFTTEERTNLDDVIDVIVKELKNVLLSPNDYK